MKIKFEEIKKISQELKKIEETTTNVDETNTNVDETKTNLEETKNNETKNNLDETNINNETKKNEIEIKNENNTNDKQQQNEIKKTESNELKPPESPSRDRSRSFVDFEKKSNNWVASTDEVVKETNEKLNDSARDLVYSEMCSSEVTYNQYLEKIVSIYIPVMNSLMSKEEVKALFSNVQILYNFSEQLKSELKKRLDTWNSKTTLVGELYLKFSPFFDRIHNIVIIMMKH